MNPRQWPFRRRTRRVGGWGRLASARVTVERPAHPTEVEAALGRAGEAGVIARGLGRSYGDAAQVDGGWVVSTSGLRQAGPVDATSGTVDVGAGIALGTLMKSLVPQGWMLPVLPGTRHVTVGGAIAADIHGKNHHTDGSFSDYVEAFTLVLPDGSSRTVTRDRDPRLFDATVGGLGLTGVVTSARLRLAPAASGFMRVQYDRVRDLDALLALMTESDRDARYSVAWLDLAAPHRLGRALLETADIAERDWLPAKRREAVPSYGLRRRLVMPPLPGRGLVRSRTVRAFNTAYWRLPRRRERFVPLASFFHPLDMVGNLNRIYGRGGLIQYQCVVPVTATGLVKAILRTFAEGPVTPTLAVLKRLGPSTGGMLSFPMPGWTIAVDLPADDARAYLMLDELDDVVATAGGRVYLAKDARLRPDMLARMYPRLDEWRAVKAEIDPEGRVRSDLAVRLGLVSPPA